jgi:hypothetical protein
MRSKIVHAGFERPGVLFSASDSDDTEPTPPLQG